MDLTERVIGARPTHGHFHQGAIRKYNIGRHLLLASQAAAQRAQTLEQSRVSRTGGSVPSVIRGGLSHAAARADLLARFRLGRRCPARWKGTMRAEAVVTPTAVLSCRGVAEVAQHEVPAASRGVCVPLHGIELG